MDTPAVARAPSAVGHLLRAWRATRGMSQLDLALQAGFSAASRQLHRDRPHAAEPQALLVLAETLDVPLRERNRLLEAGGYARVYRADAACRRGDGARPRGAAIHPRSAPPFAAIVLDRYSNCLMGNAARTGWSTSSWIRRC